MVKPGSKFVSCFNVTNRSYHDISAMCFQNENWPRNQLLQNMQQLPRTVRRIQSLTTLDVIISVGYRVKSHRGTQFRIRATQRLREYLVKEFTMNDDLLKRAGGGNYFEELLERIRDVRSSEKAFWKKVLDIFSTSIDYDPNFDISRQFFATVQNKMHFAAHRQTAAEVVSTRADGAHPNLGMRSWTGQLPTKREAEIARTT
ncbi:hypothetical protein BH23CHL4_BH23CHL4_22370 [soil metagenome]